MTRNIEDSIRFADQYLDFLLSEHGFEKVPPHNVSYDYHFGYRRENIAIDLLCEADGTSTPTVRLVDYRNVSPNGDSKYPQYYHLTEIELPQTIKEVYNNRNLRYNPKVKRFVAAFDPKKENYKSAHQELDEDYEEVGREESELIIRESAAIIKRHPQILSGDLSPFPRKEQTKSDIIKVISIRQPDGTMKTKKYKNGKRIIEGGIIEWIKSLFD